MPRTYRRREYTVTEDKMTTENFLEKISMVPLHHFAYMISKSGFPAKEAREICQKFKELSKR